MDGNHAGHILRMDYEIMDCVYSGKGVVATIALVFQCIILGSVIEKRTNWRGK